MHFMCQDTDIIREIGNCLFKVSKKDENSKIFIDVRDLENVN